MLKSKSSVWVGGLFAASAVLLSACGAQAASPQATEAPPVAMTQPSGQAGGGYDYGSGYGRETEAPASTEAATQEAAGGGAIVNLGGNSALGSFLVDADGYTLYTFANDSAGKSTCTGGCASNWPPLTVAAGEQLVAGEGVTGQLATATRDDGSLQVTYNGMPLYRYGGDNAPGDANGQDVGGVWYVAAP